MGLNKIIVWVACMLHFVKQTHSFGWSDITHGASDAWDAAASAGSDLIDDIDADVSVLADNLSDFISNDVAHSLAGVYHAIDSAGKDATQAVTGYLETLDSDAQTAAAAVETVPYMKESAIDEKVAQFSEKTWEHVQDGSKFVLKTLKKESQDLLNEGLEFLEDLLDAGYVPFPLSVIEREDITDLSKCVDSDVLEFLEQWSEEMGNSLIADKHFDVSSPTIEGPIRDSFEKSLVCMGKQAKKIWDRKKDTAIDSAVQAAYDWMKFEDEFVVSIEISFAACSVACGSVGLGLAASAVNPEKVAIYRTVTTGVDLGASISGALDSSLGFHPSFEDIAGESHIVAFDLELPIIPKFMPEIGLGITTSGGFGGMVLITDALDKEFKLSGVLDLSYKFVVSDVIMTSKDLEQEKPEAVNEE